MSFARILLFIQIIIIFLLAASLVRRRENGDAGYVFISIIIIVGQIYVVSCIAFETLEI